MLDTIIIPYDIVGYIIERSTYMPEHGEQRLVIDDSVEEFTLLCRPQSEKDYSEMYLVKNYFKQNIETGYVKFYNELLSSFYEQGIDEIPELFATLISADSLVANRIVQNYCYNVEHIRDDIFSFPLFIFTHTDGIMFFRRPFNMSEDEFNHALENLSLYFAYKHKLAKIYALVYKSENEESFSLTPSVSGYSLPEYDDELEKLKQDIESLIK